MKRAQAKLRSKSGLAGLLTGPVSCSWALLKFLVVIAVLQWASEAAKYIKYALDLIRILGNNYPTQLLPPVVVLSIAPSMSRMCSRSKLMRYMLMVKLSGDTAEEDSTGAM